MPYLKLRPIAIVGTVFAIVFLGGGFNTVRKLLSNACAISSNPKIIYMPGNDINSVRKLIPIDDNNISKLSKIVTIEGYSDPRTVAVFASNLIAIAGSNILSPHSQQTCTDIWLWNVTDNQMQVIELSNKNRTIDSLIFSTNTHYMISSELGWGIKGYTLKLWDINTLNNQVLIENSPISPVGGFSPNGTYLVYGTDDELYLRDLQTNATTQLFIGNHFSQGNPVISQDGNLIAIVTDDGRLRVWNIEKQSGTGFELSQPMVKPQLLFTDQDKQLLVVETSPKVRVPRQVEVVDISGQVTPLSPALYSDALSLDENSHTLTIVGRDGHSAAWDLNTSKPISDLHLGLFTQMNLPLSLWISISPVARIAADVSRRDGTLSLWNLETGQLIQSFKGDAPYGYNGVAFSPQGNMLVAFWGSSEDNTGVDIWGVLP